MTTQELIENALLDAFGLLDEQERMQFEMAFRAAVPELQAQVRREQARLSRLDQILPEVDPPIGLRAAVIERVRDEIARERSEEAERVIQHAAGRDVAELVPSRRVHSLWRSAALGLLAASVVFGAATFQMNREYGQLQQMLANNSLVDELLDNFGQKIGTSMFDPTIQRVVFNPVDPSGNAGAMLLFDPERGEAYLVCKGLPAEEKGRAYRLVVLTAEDEIDQTLARFEASGRLIGPAVEVSLAPTNDIRLGIVPEDAAGNAMELVLQTRVDLRS